MNAPTVIATLEQAHRMAVEDANQWRGRMINWYAKAENQISRALLKVKAESLLPMLFSQKISQLKKLAAGDHHLLDIVQQLEVRLDERNSLVHGDGSIWIGRNGRWLLQLSHHGRKGISRLEIHKDDAESRCDDLARLVRRLESKLKN